MGNNVEEWMFEINQNNLNKESGFYSAFQTGKNVPNFFNAYRQRIYLIKKKALKKIFKNVV